MKLLFDALRRRTRVRPADPAIFAWVAVALLALVPLEHAVASIARRAPAHAGAPALVQPAAPPASDQDRGAGSATP